jgi:hypothetical protein
MSKRELAEFILKLLGVYAIIHSLPLFLYISLIFGSIGRDSNEASERVWMYLCMSVPFALTLVAAIVLLTCSHKLASALVKEDGPTGLTTSLSSQEIQTIGFSIVAVLVFLLAIPQLVQFSVTIWRILTLSATEFEGARSVFVRNAWQSGLSFAIQLTLAVLLFFRSRGLTNLWRRIQIAKYEKIEES